MDPAVWIFGGLLLLAVGLAAWWVRRAVAEAAATRPPDPLLALLQNQVQATAQQTAQQMEHLRGALQQIHAQTTQSLGDTRKAMDDRLDGAAASSRMSASSWASWSEKTQHLRNRQGYLQPAGHSALAQTAREHGRTFPG
jgi:uncharacterized membrane protein YccC